MLQMGHLRNALIRHRNTARGAHRHAFILNLQNAHLTDLHRHDPAFKKYTRRLLESVAREVNKSYRTYFRCTNCGHEANATVNAAENIRHQGLDILARGGDPLGLLP